jgi:hypothetical protein
MYLLWEYKHLLTPTATKVTRATDEYCALVVEDLLAGLCILGDATVHNQSSGTLVHNLHELGHSDKLGFSGNRELSDLEELLAVKEHTRVEVGDDLIKGEGRLSVERWYNTECGDYLEVLVTFVDERKVGALSANSEVWKLC